MARFLRRSGRPIRVVANKVDASHRETDAWEAVSLGLGDPLPVSGLHGRGTGDLLDDVVGCYPSEGRSAPRRAGSDRRRRGRR